MRDPIHAPNAASEARPYRGAPILPSVRSKVSDHVDAAALFVRLLHYLPTDGDHESAHILLPQLRFLAATHLDDQVQKMPEALGLNFARVCQYLGLWNQLSTQLESALSNPTSEPPMVFRVNQILANSRVPAVLRDLQVRYQGEAGGATWREGEGVRSVTSYLADEAPPDSAQFLNAFDNLLQARYSDAGLGFDRLAEANSVLSLLSRYLAVEASLRGQQVDRALAHLSYLHLNVPQDSLLLHMDTVGLLYQVLHTPRSPELRPSDQFLPTVHQLHLGTAGQTIFRGILEFQHPLRRSVQMIQIPPVVVSPR
jgi:hypothetical protein